MICSSFSAVVYPVGLVWLRVCRISRTVAGPPSHKTRKIASSPSVGRGGLGGMDRLLTKCFVNVNENIRHFTGLDEQGHHVRLTALRDSLGRRARIAKYAATASRPRAPNA